MNRPLLTQSLWAAGWVAAAAAGWFLRTPAPSASGPDSRVVTAQRDSAPALPGKIAAAAPRPASGIIAAVRRAAGTDPLADRGELLDLIESLSAEELSAVMPRLYPNHAFRVLGMHQWARKDPAGAFHFLQNVAPELQNNLDPKRETSAALFREWARQDPQAAWAAAKSARLDPVFENAMWSTVSSVMQTDPAAALQMAAGMKLPAGFERVNAGEITAENAGEFMKGWASVADGNRFDSRFDYIVNRAISTWSEQDPAAALAWAKSQPDNRRVQFLPDILDALAATDPQAALAEFSSLPPSPEREKAGPGLAARMAATDPAGALAWIDANLQAGRSEAAGRIARTIASQDPQQALSLLDAMNPGPSRDAYIASTAAGWAQKDLASAAQWAQDFPPGAERVAAINAIADEWIARDPASFTRFAATAPPAEVPVHLVESAAHSLAVQAPAEAAAWVATLDGTRSEHAVSGVVGRLTAENDGAHLTEFLGALPAATRQSALREALVDSSLAGDTPPAWLATAAGSPALKSSLTTLLPDATFLSAAQRKEWLGALQPAAPGR